MAIDASASNVICVLGMHRSGTSLTTSVLNTLGASLPAPVLDAQQGVNAAGFWEDKAVVGLNEAVLAEKNSTWYDLDARNIALTEDISSELLEGISAHIDQYYKSEKISVLKDPRLCRLIPIWSRGFAELDIDVSYVYVLRSPFEIAASLKKRDNIPVVHSLLLWVLYTYDSLQFLETRSPLVVAYKDFLDNGETVVGQLNELLAQLGYGADEAGLELALSKVMASERHQKHTSSDFVDDCDSSIVDFVDEFYLALLSAQSKAVPLIQVLSQYQSRIETLFDKSLSLVSEINNMTDSLVKSSGQLVDLGTEMSEARIYIADLESRLQEIGDLHTHAQSVVKERDEQLQEIGDLHTHAQSVVKERDEQLQEKNTQLQEQGQHMAELTQKNQVLYSRIELIRSTLVGRFADWFSRKIRRND